MHREPTFHSATDGKEKPRLFAIHSLRSTTLHHHSTLPHFLKKWLIHEWVRAFLLTQFEAGEKRRRRPHLGLVPSAWGGPEETDKAVQMGPGCDTTHQWSGSVQGPRRSGFFEARGLEKETDQSEFRMSNPLQGSNHVNRKVGCFRVRSTWVPQLQAAKKTPEPA